MFWAEVKNRYKYGGLKAACTYTAFWFMNRIMYFDVLHTMSLQIEDVDKKYRANPPEPIKEGF